MSAELTSRYKGKVYWWAGAAAYVLGIALGDSPFRLFADVVWFGSTLACLATTWKIAKEYNRNPWGWTIGTGLVPLVFWFLYFKTAEREDG